MGPASPGNLIGLIMAVPLKILHLASFSGNIGDNANHMGFRPWFEKQLGRSAQWHALEIREFYWNERSWDDALVDYINDHDVMVIGGGNYFELWVEYSPTGTSIAIDPDTFSKIRTPIFFNALGVDPGQGVPEICRQRFSTFLDVITGSDHCLVSVRNDGALFNLKTHIRDFDESCVYALPDHGFFVPHPSKNLQPNPTDQTQICINLACDMAQTRFPGNDGQAGFAKEMARLVSRLSERHTDAHVTFVPHIFRDLEIISQTLSFIPDRLRRTRIAVASFGSGNAAAKRCLAHYANADLVFGMRFHANVCPMALERQVLGLSSYVQINNLYKELEQTHRLIDVTRPGFADIATELASAVFRGDTAFHDGPAEAVSRVTQARQRFEPVLRNWLSQIA